MTYEVMDGETGEGQGNCMSQTQPQVTALL